MATTTNVSSQYAGATVRYIARKALEETQRYLVVHQFADKVTLDHGHGVTWSAIRWSRLPLPQYPIAEGVAPQANTLQFTQVMGSAVQWAGRLLFTDVALITTQQDLISEGSRMLGMQIGETKERNAMVALMSGSQINYANSVGARASLGSGDNLNPTDVSRTFANMVNLGVHMWNGQTGEDVKRSIDYNARASEKTIKGVEHLVAIANAFPLDDLANNPTVVATWMRSDINRLYINEMGYWKGITFCRSNMIPSFVGVAQVNGTPGTGTLTTGTYTIQVTGWDNQNFYESRIYQLSADIAVIAGGINVTVPSTAGFTYAVYVGVGSGAAAANLGLSTSGPSSGPFSGQAIGIAPGTAVVITGLGSMAIPPAAPATGITVWPTFIFGRNAFASLKLEGLSWNRLMDADKSDPHNQLRSIGWKMFEGWVIKDQRFLARLETTASNAGAFT
jgi:N4-gp56 family major capsid protein